MSEQMNFASLLALCEEDTSRVTPKGLDTLYDILEHFYNGGSATNHPQWSYQEIMILLGVAWTTIRDDVRARHDIN